MQKALQLKFACGKTGYMMLLDQGMPLPSLATLQRRMKEIDFTPGVLPHVFRLLKLKASQTKMCNQHWAFFDVFVQYSVGYGNLTFTLLIK